MPQCCIISLLYDDQSYGNSKWVIAGRIQYYSVVALGGLISISFADGDVVTVWKLDRLARCMRLILVLLLSIVPPLAQSSVPSNSNEIHQLFLRSGVPQETQVLLTKSHYMTRKDSHARKSCYSLERSSIGDDSMMPPSSSNTPKA